MIDLDDLSKMVEEADNAAKHLGGQACEWGYYDANTECLQCVQENGFVHILFRDGFYRTDRESYVLAAAAMNALPALIECARALEHVVGLWDVGERAREALTKLRKE